jgi:hypothetical protein
VEQLKPFWDSPLDVYFQPAKPPGFVGPMPQVKLEEGKEFQLDENYGMPVEDFLNSWQGVPPRSESDVPNAFFSPEELEKVKKAFVPIPPGAGQVVLGIDPGFADGDRIGIAQIRRLLTDAGYKVEVVSFESIPKEGKAVLLEDYPFEIDVEMLKTLAQPVLMTPEEEPKNNSKGPKRSKYQRGKWWNR